MVHPFLVILKANQRLVLVNYLDCLTVTSEIITGHLEYGHLESNQLFHLNRTRKEESSLEVSSFGKHSWMNCYQQACQRRARQLSISGIILVWLGSKVWQATNYDCFIKSWVCDMVYYTVLLIRCFCRDKWDNSEPFSQSHSVCKFKLIFSVQSLNEIKDCGEPDNESLQ